jgi:hypothetical protein
MAFAFDTVVSLGPDCLPAMRISQYFARHRRCSSPFSYQITPRSALVEYFARDFRGMFEKDDMIACGPKAARNTRFGTIHPHEFANGLASYEQARSRHDYLCEKMRALAHHKGGVVFVTYGSDTDGIDDVIAKAFPELSFRVINPFPEAIVEAEWPRSFDVFDAAFRRLDREAGAARSVFAQIHSQYKRLSRHVSDLRF